MLKILVVAGLILLGIRLWFYYFEGRSLYYPMAEWEASPSDFGLAFENLGLTASDGTRLNAWYIPANPQAHCILYLHGNAGNISHRLAFLSFFHRLGLATLIVDYRGYGKSAGHPSERGLYKDARAAYDYLAIEKRLKPENILLFGESLGGAVAIELATHVPVGAVLCEGAFSSALDMGRIYFPHLPLRLLITQRYDALSRVNKVRAPKFFVHSRQDEIVPFALGKKLFEAACPPKEFIERPGDHNNALADPGVYERALRKLLSK